MKLAVVGGGSTYTPELIDGLLRRRAQLPVDTVSLYDPSAQRLGVIGGFVARMCQAAGGGLRLETTDDLRECVGGADFVVSQFRIGGQQARHGDELLGRRWGVVGQETTGVGGFAKGLRTIPVALAVQAAVAKHAAAGAWLINFTNPAGMVTEALLAHGVGDPPRVLGLCNYPWVLRAELAAGLRAPADAITFDYAGLNHLSWVRDVLVDGRSRFAEAWAVWRHGLETDPDAPFRLAVADDVGLICNSYLQYYYETSRILERQRHTETRAEVVLRIEAALLRRYGEEARYDPEMLRHRGGAYYSEAAAALLTDLHTDARAVHVVNVRNNGALPGVADDVVIETSCEVGADGARPLPVPAVREPIKGLLTAVKDYELLAIQAAVSGDTRAARLALVAHPLAVDGLRAGPFLDDLLTTNSRWLPQFA